MHTSKKGKNAIKKTIWQNPNLQKIINKKNQLIDWTVAHPWKTLGICYVLLVLFIFSLAALFSKPVALADDFIYMKMARSFFYNQGFSIADVPTHKYPPLYSILLSPAYVFNGTGAIYNAMMFINALLYSTLIFPMYLLSKEFLDKRKSIMLSIISTIVPVYFLRNLIVLSENLLFPLFIFTTFFLCKAVFEEGYKFKLLTGFFIGLCFLTRIVAIIFFPAVILIFVLFELYRRDTTRFKSIVIGIKNWLIVCIISGVTILPWLLRNGSLFGFTPFGIIGYTGYGKYTVNIISKVGKSIATDDIASPVVASGETPIFLKMVETFSIETVIFNGFLIFSTGVIFFALGLALLHRTYKERQLKMFLFGMITFIFAEMLVFLAAFHYARSFESWTLSQHRYVEPIIPLILIFGVMALVNLKKIEKTSIVALFICTAPLMFIVNIVGFTASGKFLAMIWDGFRFLTPYSQVFGIIAIIFVILMFIVLLRYRVNKKTWVVSLALLIIFSSGFVMSSKYVSIKNTIAQSELYSLGEQFDEMFSGENVSIVFDDDSLKCYGVFTVLASMVNAPLFIMDNTSLINSSDPGIFYFVTFSEQDLPLLLSKNISSPYKNIPSASTYGYKSSDWNGTVYIYEIDRTD